MKYLDKKTQIIEFYWFNRTVLELETKVVNVYIVVLFCFRNLKMALTQVKISFGKFFPLFLKYWNCVLNRENREPYEIFMNMNRMNSY